jgi:hypothetical protein
MIQTSYINSFLNLETCAVFASIKMYLISIFFIFFRPEFIGLILSRKPLSLVRVKT